MDIRKLVNQGQAAAHQSLPSFSSIFPDPSVAAAVATTTGYHYPIAPQGEAGGYTTTSYSHYAPYPQHQLFLPQQPQPQQQQPSYNPTKFDSSAERTRSASVDDDDDAASSASDDNNSASSSGGSTTPLPPYVPQQQPQQQVCFVDTTTAPTAVVSPTSPSSSSSSSSDYVCQDCGVSYSRAPDLRRHKASVHGDRVTGDKVTATFPCEVCGQVLLSSHGYQGHMRRHYDERPFVCEAPFCGKSFHDSATLARHRRTHSTEHKFECDFCGRRFKRKDNLNTHRKKHQVGGETINPNLLRKPVARVAENTSTASSTGSGSGSGSSSPQIPSYGDVPTSLAPPYQALPPVPPQYSPLHHHHHLPYPPPLSHHQSQYPPPQPHYHQPSPPSYYPPQQQQFAGVYGRYAVKAEEMGLDHHHHQQQDAAMFQHHQQHHRMRMVHLPPTAR